MRENPDKTGNNRNPDGTFKKGMSGNERGRPEGSGSGLKDYDRQRFQAMDEKHKIEFLKTISPELRYRMAEGNPAQTTESKVEITLPTPLLESVRNYNSNKETPKAKEKD